MLGGEKMGTIFQSIIVMFIILISLVLIDFVLAVALHLKVGSFDWNKFLNYLKSGLTPYILIWTVLSLLSIGLTYLGGWLGYEIGLEAIIPLTSIIGIVALTITAKAVKSIYDKFKEMGIEINK